MRGSHPSRLETASKNWGRFILTPDLLERRRTAVVLDLLGLVAHRLSRRREIQRIATRRLLLTTICPLGTILLISS